MKKLLVIIASLFTMFAPFTAHAAAGPIKIGIIDMNQILQKAPLMISLNADLVKKFQARQDEINKANKDLNDETNNLQYSNTLTDAEKTKLTNKIIEDRANLQILQASFQRDLQIAKDQAMQTFMTKFSQVINKVAKDGNYDLIEQRANIAYMNNELDITSDVLKQLTN
jgi:outer membrane protein